MTFKQIQATMFCKGYSSNNILEQPASMLVGQESLCRNQPRLLLIDGLENIDI
jgi:hypothetical protein